MKTELDWAREIVAGRRLPTIIELGAHHGNETIRIYDACSTQPSIYVAVEADPRNIAVLARRIQGRRNIVIVHAAIANYSGEIDFHLSDGGDASGSIREPKEHLVHFPQIRFERTVRVPALALNELASQYKIGHVNLIWCDIQGAERDMIEGGNLVLERTEYLFAEADRCEMYQGQAQRDELISLLPSFELIAEWPENANLLFRNRDAV